MLSDHRKDSASAEKRPTKPSGSNSNDFDPSIDQPPPLYPTKPDFDLSIDQPPPSYAMSNNPSYEMSNNMDDQVDIPTISPLLNQPQRPEDIEATGFDCALSGIDCAFNGINLRCSNSTKILLVIAMFAFILVFIWMLFKNPSMA
ncbi:hypothetical protein EG329_008675 [Mollisiaceae sp. DMI_Dod_QoI]|nr:hypothetical protein EG329_008675 [Helotiales sp. DMI_Dod_QoI]